jgi:serine protease Do
MKHESTGILGTSIIAVLMVILPVNVFPPSARAASVVDALPSFSPLIRQIAPAVVNVSTETMVKPETNPDDESAPGNEGFREFMEKFFGNRPERPLKRKALGSGFIVDPSGLILTNNHVVQKATSITVVLPDQRDFKATIIGTDPKTDVALIKITTSDRLPTLPLGDSNKAEVGDWVIAVGNPFGLSSTISHGIISAKGRFIGLGPYDDFIQTDAPINPGNSGGPLLNLRGEVIGITTAMSTGQSIGFAIPSNLVKTVSDQLREKGKVTRGFIGVSIQEITPQLVQAFGLRDTKGALVGDVVQGGPADQAGVKRGDVIITFSGTPVRSANDLPMIVAGTPVGKTVPMTFVRDGKDVTVQVHVQELKEQKAGRLQGQETPESYGELGLSISNITTAMQQQLGLKEKGGVIVVSVKDGSPASDAGIERGDVILSIDRKTVNNVNEFKTIITASKKGEPLLLLIKRESTSLFVTVERP